MGLVSDPKVYLKPLIHLREHKKFVTEVKMEPWTTDIFGRAGFG